MADLKEITQVAAAAGIEPSELETYGRWKAKVDLSILDRLRGKRDGRYIVVTAITPTPLGEGKTVTNISLALGLARLGRKVINTLRQPSMGPIFGVKGGATGGGRAQVEPREGINFHFTGDIHAVGTAHNLLASLVDNHLYYNNPLGFDPKEIYWNRTIDMNDRTLRRIVIGLGGSPNGITRESGFDITAASEVMTILALAEGYADLKRRLGSILVGESRSGEAILARQMGAEGPMGALLADALKPNLVQTSEGTPCLIHTGPFANVAHGNSSVIADRIALKLAEFVVTEAGFGSDMGAEKFINIKCRASGLVPHLAVLVVTVRALKMHGGAFRNIRTEKAKVEQENVEAVRVGCDNLDKHIENLLLLGLPVVVAINRFPSDTKGEIAAIQERALQAGAKEAVPHEGVLRGGEGAVALAEAVVRHSAEPAPVKFLYETSLSIEEKIRAVATKMYGAGSIELAPKVKRRIAFFEKAGLGGLPICVAKTPASLSHDPKLLNRPAGFKFPITDILAAAGAGFVYPMAGEIMMMPGLPADPAAAHIDIDDRGRISGIT